MTVDMISVEAAQLYKVEQLTEHTLLVARSHAKILKQSMSTCTAQKYPFFKMQKPFL